MDRKKLEAGILRMLHGDKTSSKGAVEDLQDELGRLQEVVARIATIVVLQANLDPKETFGNIRHSWRI